MRPTQDEPSISLIALLVLALFNLAMIKLLV